MSRKDDIIACGRKFVDEKGVSKISVKAITAEVGCTRTLFYHYFNTKSELLTAILDSYVDSFMEDLEKWNKNRTKGDIEGAVRDIVTLARRDMFDEGNKSNFRRNLAKYENAALYTEFINIVAKRFSEYLCETTAKDYDELHGIKIDYLYETFYVLILGITGFLRANPSASDECLQAIITQTLHMNDI